MKAGGLGPSAVATVECTLFPTSSPFYTFSSFSPLGLMARLALASSLRMTGSILTRIVDLVLQPINAEGRLVAARGKGAENGAMSIDEGLYAPVMALHSASYEIGKRVTVG